MIHVYISKLARQSRTIAVALTGILILVLVSGARSAVASSPSSPLSWSSPKLIDSAPPRPLLDAASCPSISLCVAVDHFGGIVTSTDPTGGVSRWAFSEVGEAYKPNEPCQLVSLCLRGVSCPSTTLCVAVGGSGQIATSTDPTGGADAWTQTTIDGYHALEGISCPSTSFCVAVDSGGNVLATNDPAGHEPWSVTHLEDHALYAVSCASMSLCVAVDEVGNAFVSTDPAGGAAAWSGEEVDVGHSLLGVSCRPSSSLCVAVDGLGDALTTNDPAGGAEKWSKFEIDHEEALGGVSCSSSSLCVAFDGSGNVLTSADPTGGASMWTASHVDSDNYLFGVTCASGTTLCVAVNGYGDVLTSTSPEAGGSWTRAHIDSNNPSKLYDVSCPSISQCVAVDDARSVVTTTDPTGGTWNLTDKLEINDWGIFCASDSMCISGNGNDREASIEPTAPESWYTVAEFAQPPFELPPHFAPHFRASCPAITLCVAVDALGDAGVSTAPTVPSTAEHPAWTEYEHPPFPAYEGPKESENIIDPIFGVSCASTSFCAMVDSHGYVSTTAEPANAKGNWTPMRIDGETPLEDISCPSSSLCVAVDEEGNVLSSTDPTGGASAWRSASVDPGHAITGVSCPSTSLCVAVGDTGNAFVSTDPSGGAEAWSVSDVDPAHERTPVYGLTAVSCPSTKLCITVDKAGYAVVGTAPGEPPPPEGERKPPCACGSESPRSTKERASQFAILRVRVHRGRIRLTVRVPAAGLLKARAAATIMRTRCAPSPAARTAKHDRRCGRRTVTYAAVVRHARSAGTIALMLAPRAATMTALKVACRLRVRVTVTFEPRHGTSVKATRLVTIRDV